MNLFLRAAVAALTGAAVLLAAACSSPTSNPAPPPSVGSTASAWVRPPPSAPDPAFDSSESSGPLPNSSDDVVVATSIGQSFVETPFPAGLTPEQTADAKGAISSAREYWKLADEIGAEPQLDWTDRIKSVTTGTAADGLEQSVTLLRQDGVKGVGSTSVEVAIARVTPGAVDLVMCVDVSGHDFLNGSGDSYNAKKEAGALARFRAESQVGQYNSGWKVSTTTNYPSEPC